MKKLFLVLIMLGLVGVSNSEEIFSELEHTVGFIKTSKGEKYIVVETKSGAKLVKTEKDPEEVIQKKIGISKDDLNFQ